MAGPIASRGENEYETGKENNCHRFKTGGKLSICQTPLVPVVLPVCFRCDIQPLIGNTPLATVCS